jgi:4,5-dihydroxyphthalate decarboxylase
MGNISVTMACGPYDRFEALHHSVVRPEGIDLTYLAIQSPPEIFVRMVKNGSFDISEMSASMYLTRKAQGDFPFIALPIFPLRMFRHGFIFVNTLSGIKTPKDLEGKRIGVQEHRQTAGIWIRGILRSEYGVSFENVKWFEGGVNTPRRPDAAMDLRPQTKLQIESISEGKTLSDMLAAGEIDALLGARKPNALGVNPHVARLFPNYREVELEFYKRTRVFPIMHTLVMKESLYREKPWVAESIYKACEEAKAWCLKQMQFSGAIRYMLPWLLADVDEMTELFGNDPWPYGLERNQQTLNALVQHLVSERFLAEPVKLQDMFARIVTWSE